MRFAILVLLALVAATPARATAAIRVLTTLPDLADFVRQIGGDRVEARSLLTGMEDIHTYEPKVSDVKAVAGSRVLVMVGLGLENWLQGLLRNASNDDLLVVESAKGVELVRGEPERSADDHVHAEGNPHVWLDPANVSIMCKNIARALESVDPGVGDYYQKRLGVYLRQLDASSGRLRSDVAQLKDRRFLSYHPAWPYLARGFGFTVAGVVVEVPGQEPSARGLAALIERIRAERLRVLVTEPQLPSKLPRLLTQETGIRVVTLSDVVGYGGTTTYIRHMEANVRALVTALREATP
jgi:ABC-type Zn uptake system ZnuABC Zn-binding protein ZnuA